jgi:hypothetical protein
MRLRLSAIRGVVKRDLPIEFVEQDITSYSGLELFRRYFRLIELHRRVRDGCDGVGVRSDYGCANLVLVVIAMLLVGARRLEQLKYIAHDPLVKRLCELKRIPSGQTVANFLKEFTQQRLRALVSVNSELLYEQIERLNLTRLTIDVDGTVVQTGNKVGWALRGFNPHRKKNRSYYPLLAHLAQTGQILRVRNRPGNVHDSKGVDGFLRELIGELRERFGRRLPLEFRMDAAFFKEKVLKRLEREGCEYAIKAGMWPWLGLKELVAQRKRWHRVNGKMGSFETQYYIEAWDITVRLVIYRKRVRHKSPRNYQLDLFCPDDGYYEYSAVATNKSLTPEALWEFAAGRGAQEKTLSELRGEFALDVVPTNNYQANNAWQQLSVLAHNLFRGFQLDTIALSKTRTRKRTFSYLLNSARTLRFLLISKAGRLARIGGKRILRLSANQATQTLYESIELALAA